jgi:hypothetical protein
VQELQQLGWSDGRNVRIDYRWAAGDAALFHRYAEELLALPRARPAPLCLQFERSGRWPYPVRERAVFDFK